MDNWVITYNAIDNGDKLIYNLETIEGKNAKDALKTRFKTNFNRLTGDAGRYAEVILQKGYFENNTIHLTSNGALLCYERLERIN
jgi:hypothetical protein